MFHSMCAICLPVVLLTFCPTPALSAEPFAERMIDIPREIFASGEAGFLTPGQYSIPEPLLAFTRDGWAKMSRVLRAEHERSAETAVKEAVIPWMEKVKSLERGSQAQWWVYGSLGAIIVVETLILILR